MRATFRSQMRGAAFWAKCFTGTASLTFGSFYVWTRHSQFEPFDSTNDKLFGHPLLKIINPSNNPDSHDSYVRRVPFSQIQLTLLQDALQGGTRLIEAFAAGMWGGYGYGIQRQIMRFTKTKENEEDLWSKAQLQDSVYEPGQYFTNHFHVLSKSPTSLIMRACVNPRQDPPVPQEMDNLVELEAQIEEASKTVAFRFKSITFNGTDSSSQSPDPFGGFPGWLHRQYVKLLVESGVDNCT